MIMRAEWKSVRTFYGGQFVIIPGIQLMQWSSADNLDFQQKVPHKDNYTMHENISMPGFHTGLFYWGKAAGGYFSVHGITDL